MRRRDFLNGASALSISMVGGVGWTHAATGAGPAMPGSGLPADDVAKASWLADHLLGAFGRQSSLARIGAVFREEGSAGAEHNPISLTEAVAQFLDHLAWSEEELLDMAPSAIRARVRQDTARDFNDGRMAAVRGWLLGETEVRLCSVAALRAA